MEDHAAGEQRDALPVGVSNSRHLCRQHNKNLPSNNLCNRNLSVTACPWVLVTPKKKLHFVCSQIIVASALCQEQAGPLLCHVHSYCRQESPRTGAVMDSAGTFLVFCPSLWDCFTDRTRIMLANGVRIKIQIRIPIDKISTGLRMLESLCWEMLHS